jgi:hypothetical protein
MAQGGGGRVRAKKRDPPSRTCSVLHCVLDLSCTVASAGEVRNQEVSTAGSGQEGGDSMSTRLAHETGALFCLVGPDVCLAAESYKPLGGVDSI